MEIPRGEQGIDFRNSDSVVNVALNASIHPEILHLREHLKSHLEQSIAIIETILSDDYEGIQTIQSELTPSEFELHKDNLEELLFALEEAEGAVEATSAESSKSDTESVFISFPNVEDEVVLAIPYERAVSDLSFIAPRWFWREETLDTALENIDPYLIWPRVISLNGAGKVFDYSFDCISEPAYMMSEYFDNLIDSFTLRKREGRTEWVVNEGYENEEVVAHYKETEDDWELTLDF